MNPSDVRVHEHLLALVVRAEGGAVTRRQSYGLAGAGVGESLAAGRVVLHRGDRIERVAGAPAHDALLDALEKSWPVVSGLTSRPAALSTWVRRTTMIHGHRAAELAGERLCATGVLERESPSGGIVTLMREGVEYRELDVAAVDQLVRIANDAATDPGPVSPSLQVVVLGAEALGLLDPLGIPAPAWREQGPPWVDVVARALTFAGVEFGVRAPRPTG